MAFSMGSFGGRGHDHSHGHDHGHDHGHNHDHSHGPSSSSLTCNALLADAPNVGPQNPLQRQWMAARDRLPEIEIALADLIKDDQEMGRQLYAAAQAAVGKHHDIYTRARSVQNLDIGRHMEILRNIAEFNLGRPLFSLYKIKRAIEGRYSLKDYIECR